MAKTIRFKRPIPNTKTLITRESRKKKTFRRRAAVKQPIDIEIEKYVRLYHKAKKECGGPSSVFEVMNLLLGYYINNEFIIHRRMLNVNDPAITEERKVERKEKYKKIHQPTPKKPKRIWLMLTKADNDKFARKTRNDGMSKNKVFNLLIDFYLANQFIITTTIVRTTPYRTGNIVTDSCIFEDREEERKYLEENRDLFSI